MNNIETFERLESNVRMYCRDLPLVFDTAQGSRIRGEDGREYLDFFAGAGALNYGHNDPRMRDALIAYLSANGVTHALDLHTTTKRQFLEAIERDLFKPRGWDYKVQFTGPTGADAVEAALKLARKATGRTKVVSFYGAYHGMTAGALAVTGNRTRRGPGLSTDVVFVPYEDSPYGEFDSIGFLGRLAGLRVLGRSAPSPALPLITSLHWSAAQRRELFEALNLTLIECPHLAATLALKSFLPAGEEHYRILLDYERQAQGWGYPQLR